MLSAVDHALAEAAREVSRKRYHPDRHAMGCALRTRSGRVHVGVHLECHVERLAVCAEAIAIGHAATEGDDQIEAIVAVLQWSTDDATPAWITDLLPRRFRRS